MAVAHAGGTMGGRPATRSGAYQTGRRRFDGYPPPRVPGVPPACTCSDYGARPAIGVGDRTHCPCCRLGRPACDGNHPMRAARPSLDPGPGRRRGGGLQQRRARAASAIRQLRDSTTIFRCGWLVAYNTKRIATQLGLSKRGDPTPL